MWKAVVLALTPLALGLVSFAAWVTHVVVTIQAEAWILLAIGGFIFPVGVIHGFMTWLGFGLA